MNKNEVIDDLGPFTDPATELLVSENDQAITITLDRNGQKHVCRVDRNTGSLIDKGAEERNFSSIGSFLASVDFANLRGMAATQVRVLKGIYDDPYLEPELMLQSAKGNVGKGMPGLRAVTDQISRTATRIILLDGPAGIGKTRLLQRLTYERARSYLVGQTRPILYVGSKGRRLSNLADTFAGATQAIRANFTFDQVPTLVRLGLIDVAIDGFDELVDSEGYRDAWATLQDFIAQLKGRGTCILAGRDTFFDQQSFFSRLQDKQSASQALELVQAHLLSIAPDRAKEWLQERGWKEEDINDAAEAGIFDPKSYALRPYFLSEFSKAGGWDNIEESGSARAFLVSEFIAREGDLIAEKTALSKNDARSGVREILVSAALDMAERESVEIDMDYLVLLCEIVYGKLLPKEDLQKLQHKVGSIGLLETASSRNLRQFPHSEIRYHFLAQGIIEELNTRKVPAALRRGVLGTDFLEVFQEVGAAEDRKHVENALNFANTAIKLEGIGDRLGLNGSAILLSSLSIRGVKQPTHLSNLQADECILSGTQRHCVLDGVTIFRLDARGADLSEVNFQDSEVGVLIADSLTRLGSNVPRIREIFDAGEFKIMRAPVAVQKWIGAHKNEHAAGVPLLPFEEFFQRVCRRAQRQFYFRDGADDPGSDLLRDKWWNDLASILEQEGRLRKVTKQIGGTFSILLHIKNPTGLLEPEDDDAAAVRIREQVHHRASLLNPPTTAATPAQVARTKVPDAK